ncbi:hypothetical protein EXIGLDRAFT_720983 [Exidia glandulosa HHB12029]|uniref:SnoaL-like domain-containing protein n=1 Tax=Exidia glandulosa HHB12029 TaxID=1314781 RepID=A0A165G221_EXIGL|nr:hypothetical protein EXIGLDRAFT_720983 [Exidia glandulosa HHB12029]
MTIREVVQRFLDIYASGDLKPLHTLFAPDFEFELLPKSLDVRSRKKEEFIEWVGGVFRAFAGGRVKIEIVEVIEVPKSRKVVVHVSSSRFSFRRGRSCNSHHMEYIFTFTLDESGTKVVHLREFLDSNMAVQYSSQGFVVQG